MTFDRHLLHVCIREIIAQWNDRAQVLHMGHKIDLAAELTEAVMNHLRTNGEGETR